MESHILSYGWKGHSIWLWHCHSLQPIPCECINLGQWYRW
jgi:hypothetical protein